MRCTECSIELIPGKRFCHACGTPAPLACPRCGSPVQSGFRFCPDCGSPLGAPDLDGPSRAKPASSTDTQPPRAAEPVAPDAATEDALRPPGTANGNGAAPNGADAGNGAGEAARSSAARERGEGSATPALGRLVPALSNAAGERKHVTVLFADLAGSTAIADQLDAEEYRELIDRYVEIALREVGHFEGIVNQLAGDGVMAIFGAPIAHEDAPQRAVHAALAMRDALVELARELEPRGIALRVRFGIHTGPVIAGHVGSELYNEYTAIGDTTNLASRLESLAEPGTILVSARTERLIRGHFELRKLEPLEIKGKKAKLTAFEVLRAIEPGTAIALAATRGLTPLVARTEELAQLEACFRRLGGRLAQVVAVVGEAGHGKSRLLYEFRRRIAGTNAVVLEAHGAALNRMVPYSPWVAMLRSFFEVPPGESRGAMRARVERKLHEIDPELVSLTDALVIACSPVRGDPWTDGEDSLQGERAGRHGNGANGGEGSDGPDGPEGGGTEKKHEVFAAVSQLVHRLAAQSSVVMIVEDLHWIDDPSREVIEFAAAQMENEAAMLLVSHRPELEMRWRPKSALTQIVLTPLPDDEATQMIRAVARASLPAALEARIRARADGNPLFLEEITRDLLEEGHLARGPDGMRLTIPLDEIPLPDGVQELIAARIDRLGPAAKRTAQVAAVLGRQFRRDQLETLLTDEGFDVTAALQDLERRGVIHRKVNMSEREYRFGEHVTQEVAYQSLLLRERRRLHGQIARMLEDLSGGESPERAALLAHHFSHSEEGEKAVEALLAAGKGAERLPEYRAAMRFYREAWRRTSATLDHVGTAATEQQRRQALEAAQRICHLSIVYGTGEEDADVPAVLARARELAQELGDGVSHASLMTYEGLLAMSGGSESFSRGLSLVESSVELARSSGNEGRAVNLSRALAWAYLYDGRFDDALAAMDRLLPIIKRVEDPSSGSQTSDVYFGGLFLRDSVLHQQADMAAFFASAHKTLAGARAMRNRTVSSGIASLLAQAHYARGEYADAHRWAEEGLAIGRTIGNYGAIRPNAVMLLASKVALGCRLSAREILEDIDSGISAAGNVPFYLGVLVEVLLALGEHERAGRYVEMRVARSGGRLREMLYAEAKASYLLFSPRPSPPSAEIWVEEARRHADELGSRFGQARALFLAGALALKRGQREAGGRALDLVVEISSELELGHLIRKVEALRGGETSPALAASIK